jgi:hypothetical protein
MSKHKPQLDKFERKSKAADKIILRERRELAENFTKYYIDDDSVYIDKPNRRMPFNSKHKGK